MTPGFAPCATPASWSAPRCRRCCCWPPWSACSGRPTRRPRSTSPAKLQPPSAAHWLGTDSLGRDIASQLLVGAQNAIVVGLVAVSIGVVIGVALGCLAAARRGWVDELVMRAADFTFAFPALLSAIMLGAIYGPGLFTGILAIGIFNIPVFARISRGAAQAVWAREYMLASRAAGFGPWRITLAMCCPTSPAC
jgi:peptide/nickel transport system permease protein